MNNQTILSIKNLQKYFVKPRRSLFQLKPEYVKANENISIDIAQGETLGIVGESGCGKSTFGRTIIQLQKQTGGSTLYYGDTIDNFLPAYAKSIYRNLLKTASDYDLQAAKISELKQQVKAYPIKDQTPDNEAFQEVLETYRIAKIEFETRFFNTFRLIGGLAASSNLKQVQQLLVQKDRLLRQLKQRNDERTRQQLQEVNDQLDEQRQLAKQNERFELYESYKDSGIDLSSLTKKESRQLREDLQIIFQDPYSSLDPRQKVGDIIGEGLLIHNVYSSKKDPNYIRRLEELMDQVGLDRDYINRYPHQFSGGQRQRIGIARALALNPKFIVADEAVSALDVSIQSQIINLLQSLKEKNDLTYLFITHDLSVVRYISNRIGVMYFGRLVELAPAENIFTNPQHPYTRQLLNAMPELEDEDNPRKLWDIDYETNDFSFYYQAGVRADQDWVEISPNHFVACTLKTIRID